VPPPLKSLRPDVPNHKASDQQHEAKKNSSCEQRTATRCCPNGFCWGELHPRKPEETFQTTGMCPTSEPRKRSSVQSDLGRKPSPTEGFVNTPGRAGSSLSEGAARHKAASNLKTGHVDNDVITIGLNVNVLPVNGKLQICKNFEGLGHNGRELKIERRG